MCKTMVNVNIIEGVDARNEAYEYMKQKVLNGEKFLNKEIKEKYDISFSGIRNLKIELSEELGVKLYKGKSPKEKRKKHIYYSHNRSKGYFIIQKQIDGKNVYFGYYKSAETAEKVVEELKLVDWDKSRLDEIKAKLGVA